MEHPNTSPQAAGTQQYVEPNSRVRLCVCVCERNHLPKYYKIIFEYIGEFVSTADSPNQIDELWSFAECEWHGKSPPWANDN